MAEQDKSGVSGEKNVASGDQRQDIWREDHEAMTGALQIRLSRLCERAGVPFDSSWTESQALEKLKTLESQREEDD